MNRIYLIAFCLLIVNSHAWCRNYTTAGDSVSLSEIMYDPIGSEYYDEFVEIVNISEDIVNLSGWKLGDGDDFDLLIDAGYGLDLVPGQYGLIMDSGYFEHSTTYDSMLPQTALLITIEDASFGRNGWSNSSAKTVILMNNKDQIVEQYTYNLGNQPGFSSEKVIINRLHDAQNWQESLVLNGTPGMKNSVAPLEYDLCLLLTDYPQTDLSISDSWSAAFNIENSGLQSASGFQLDGYFYDPFEIADSTLLYSNQFQETVQPGKSLDWQVQSQIPFYGIHFVRFYLLWQDDENYRNNSVSFQIGVPYKAEGIIFNEIMYQPLSGQPEWIELWNISDHTIDMLNWQLNEVTTASVYPVTAKNIELLPSQFCIVASDSSLLLPSNVPLLIPEQFPTLNNRDDHLQIQDFSGKTIDEVHYFSDWGGEEGRSLERISPQAASQDANNWTSSVAEKGATPGEINSVYYSVLAADAEISVSPNPFSPDGDGFEDVAIIQYKLPMQTAYASLTIYDVAGRKVCELLNAAPSGSNRTVLWNGKKNNGEALRMGIYIVFLEALNDKLGIIKQVKRTVVIAAKL